MKSTLSKSLALFTLLGGLSSLAHADLVCVGDRCAKPSVAVKLAPAGVIVEAAPVVTVAAPEKSAVAIWEIKASDLSIYGTLKRWSDQAGWQLSWEIPTDYPVTILGSFDNNFRGAVDSVMDAYGASDFPPKGCFYDNNVIRVVRRVGDGKECYVNNQ
jgi:hypothetical protein